MLAFQIIYEVLRGCASVFSAASVDFSRAPRERRTGPPLWLPRPVDTLGLVRRAHWRKTGDLLSKKFRDLNLLARSNNYDAPTTRKSESVESSPSPIPDFQFNPHDELTLK